MTRKSTWTNADGLVVGFGPNSPERNEAGVLETDGVVKEARLAITYQSSSANVALPAGSVVLDVVMKVGLVLLYVLLVLMLSVMLLLIRV